MDFKELLKPDVTGRDEDVIARLCRSSCPVMLYGAAGDVGDRIAGKLLAHGLRVERIILDADCPPLASEADALRGVETCTPAEADASFASYHLVPGFVKAYGDTDRIARKCRNACSVDYLSEIFDMEMIEPAFVAQRRETLEAFYEDLSDPLSKEAFVAYLLAKTRQDMQYLPPCFEKAQYFPAGIFTLTDHESYFDCGAFTGDTIAGFLKATGGTYRRIWAAEPDPSNFRQLRRFVDEHSLCDIQLINKGIYDRPCRLPFRAEGSMLSMITEDAVHSIDVDTIDHIVAGEPVTYIKMDVEGVELKALNGAEQTIRTCRPILGISIYHKKSDLIDIPVRIRSLVPEYRFYFRVHKKLAIDAVLYAVAP
jgi:FkbM family methyltransferase